VGAGMAASGGGGLEERGEAARVCRALNASGQRSVTPSGAVGK
jgi:hypothetical protein